MAFIDVNRETRKRLEREMTHKELVRSQMGGPAESLVGKGAGITEQIGPNAERMIRTMMDPKFIEATFGKRPLVEARARREELADLGRHGFNGQMAGKSLRGDLQYFGKMPLEMFVTLMWTDPTLFYPENEKRLEDYLIRSGLAVIKPRD